MQILIPILLILSSLGPFAFASERDVALIQHRLEDLVLMLSKPLPPETDVELERMVAATELQNIFPDLRSQDTDSLLVVASTQELRVELILLAIDLAHVKGVQTGSRGGEWNAGTLKDFATPALALIRGGVRGLSAESLETVLADLLESSNNIASLITLAAFLDGLEDCAEEAAVQSFLEQNGKKLRREFENIRSHWTSSLAKAASPARVKVALQVGEYFSQLELVAALSHRKIADRIAAVKSLTELSALLPRTILKVTELHQKTRSKPLKNAAAILLKKHPLCPGILLSDIALH